MFLFMGVLDMLVFFMMGGFFGMYMLWKNIFFYVIIDIFYLCKFLWYMFKNIVIKI